MKIGLFFGSFNPIHVGHALVARFALEQFRLKEVWFVVSPHNPLKNAKTLAVLSERLQAVKLACIDMDKNKFKASDVEWNLPTPSYTCDTLRYLTSKKENKKHSFHIIMGTDCLIQIEQWKDYEYILRNFPALVYNRPGYSLDKIAYTVSPTYDVRFFENCPVMEMSSTLIRQRIKKGKSIQYMVPDSVLSHIERTGMYL